MPICAVSLTIFYSTEPPAPGVSAVLIWGRSYCDSETPLEDSYRHQEVCFPGHSKSVQVDKINHRT